MFEDWRCCTDRGRDLISQRSVRLDHLLYFWLAGLISVYHVTLTAMIARTQLSSLRVFFNTVAVPLSWTVDELLCVFLSCSPV